MKISFVNIAYVGISLLLGFSACSQTGEADYETTSSGLKIKYLSEGEGTVADSGDFILMYMKYFKDDSLLFPPAGMTDPIPVQFVSDTANQVFEAFGTLKKGDSTHFQVSAEELFVNTFQAQIPPGIEPEMPITFQIGVEDVMSPEDFQAYQMEQMRKQQEDMLAQQAEQFSADSLTISEYLAENSIDAQTTESGLRYVIKEEGSGVQPSAGDSVFVHYVLKLIDGTEIQSSYDSPNGPFGFPLGQRAVIPGWDEGVALLNEGTKATLYIPSPLAYGPQDNGLIAANSILIFDVELVDVKQ
ncbi:FKBP-type peptidyl-prolyl cis-trans isomerase [Tunicatimonas pelagia]|uniref:FKBP-type peptidyl-prolyl cis-trans isomerase n=1 Tax=Tunicatimonas pelagia TaxID=931531 RepID=UPI002666A440|nr:FKBP-type peptidyl-prolyl cis-trans isomerase [Tunicatimonas pelagia]WKN45076.1 FKBP-type peptidyl-prolyl cis-trans isomerase [Tunicatimonas pelagia]